MSNKPDGGPAFPVERINLGNKNGMALRDYFAAQALPALIAEYITGNGPCIGMDHFKRNVPVIAYDLADQILEARK